MAVAWASGVNQRILRDGTNWSLHNGVVQDDSRSGKPKRHLATSMAKNKFPVKMRFSTTEYAIFKSWFENDLRHGFFSFIFPEIDSTGSTNKEYRFVAGSEPQFNNTSGLLIDCSMEWEEV